MDAPAARNAGILVAAKVVGYAFPLAVLPMLTRPLGPAAYGELVFATSVITFFQILADYGTQVTATRDVSMCRGDDVRTSEILSRVLVFRLLLCVAGYPLLLGFSGLQGYGGGRVLRLSLAYLITVGEALGPTWFFLGREMPLGFAVPTLVARVVTVPLIPLLVRSSADVNVAVMVLTLPWLIAGVLSLAWAVRSIEFTFTMPTWTQLRRELRRGAAAALSSAAASVNQPLSVVMLGTSASGAVLGMYGTAVTVIAAGKQVLVPLNQMAYARTSYLETSDPARTRGARNQAVRWIAAGGAAVSLGLLVAAPLVSSLLFGRAYVDTAPLIRLMAPVPLLFILGQAASTQYLFSTGRGRPVVLAMAAGNLACLAACMALIPSARATGASLGLLAGEVISAGLMLWAGLRAHRAVLPTSRPGPPR